MVKRLVAFAILSSVLCVSFPLATYAEDSALASDEAALGEAQPGHVTVDFKDADIHNVLRILAHKGNVNIVAGEDVQGKVTIRLVDVPWERALDVILKTYGLVQERDSNIIRINTIESLSKEELITEVFALKYAKSSEVPTSIQNMLTERGSIQTDERTNILIITDAASNLYKIRQVVESLDKKTSQIMVESKIIETTLDDDDNFGINWTVGASASGGRRPTTFPFNRTSGGGSFTPIGDASGSAVSETGVGVFLPSANAGFPSALPGAFQFGTLSLTQLSAVLQVLRTRTDTKIISNPNIVTLNNQAAEVVVATTFNIPLYERNASTGNLEITAYDERNIGITLEVTPHVNDAGDIVLDLHPQVTAFLQFDTIGEVTAPRFTTREAKTQVMVRDGETVAIGGLISESNIDKEFKIPILGDIPVLGYLFKKTEEGADRTNLIFLVTTRLLDDSGNIGSALETIQLKNGEDDDISVEQSTL